VRTQQEKSVLETIEHPSTADAQAHAPIAVPLTQLAKGQRGKITINHQTSDDAKMLSAMGLRPDASVTMCRKGEPCIVSLMGACGGGCRIGLARDIAEKVMVEIDS
jgi:Fe2+ transport system protein FeoA